MDGDRGGLAFMAVVPVHFMWLWRPMQELHALLNAGQVYLQSDGMISFALVSLGVFLAFPL